MENNQQKIDELVKRIDELSRKQNIFSTEINNLRSEIKLLQLDAFTSDKKEDKTEPIKEPVIQITEPAVPVIPPIPKEIVPKKPKQPSDLEKIIGESWLNKIGIVGILIGVTILGKYSIDNNLISPLTRIILGYLMGVGLLGFGIKLKEKFESYSAVLVSGAMAVFYFITFFGYNFYGLFPQIMAFALMVIFTVFTVFAALKYNRSVIAHIGLVGAYAVPFLLSTGSGNVLILFSYITIINLGIVAVSVKKYWKSLYYIAFSLTWIIYTFWFAVDYSSINHKIIALVFATVFFLIFYTVAITNRIIQEQKLAQGDIVLILLNSFIYFGFGYGIVNSGNTASFLGLFTLFNAVIHFVVGYIIRNKKLADKNLFYLILGLVFTFITIAIPVQLDGNWVTLSWIALSVLLFWIGRTKSVVVYENISYIILILTFFSLLHDWSEYSFRENTSFFNVTFLTSLFVIIGFGYIIYLGRKKKYIKIENQTSIQNMMNVTIPVMLGIVSFFTFLNDINLYFDKWFDSTAVSNKSEYDNYTYNTYNYNIEYFKYISQIGYSLLFFGALSLLNVYKIRDKVLGVIVVILILISLFISQTLGIFTLGELREAYINRATENHYLIGFNYIWIRYILFGFVVFGVYNLFKTSKQEFMNPLNQTFKFIAEFTFYVLILCFLSNELITWLDLAGNKGVFKLGLSILWGVYSLFLIYLGIFKQRKYLRIGAIVLFAITLLKLLFYDISGMNTLSKIIVFISLGVLLLVISFLYNKFKDKISEDEKSN